MQIHVKSIVIMLINMCTYVEVFIRDHSLENTSLTLAGEIMTHCTSYVYKNLKEGINLPNYIQGYRYGIYIHVKVYVHQQYFLSTNIFLWTYFQKKQMYLASLEWKRTIITNINIW